MAHFVYRLTQNKSFQLGNNFKFDFYSVLERPKGLEEGSSLW
ncbi:hypothetical protein HMPREF1557_00899 [Streptococcus sobrinus W1703]|uniref:Uncharacterized protein n=1 Tax=Streptococcus sobrinus W1703 TaxID=1227275 RepID=U2J9W3_9STRE|nr:hypothetical protein HMPREF1557_00899 [Streptococcus sobrinus W1703]